MVQCTTFHLTLMDPKFTLMDPKRRSSSEGTSMTESKVQNHQEQYLLNISQYTNLLQTPVVTQDTTTEKISTSFNISKLQTHKFFWGYLPTNLDPWISIHQPLPKGLELLLRRTGLEELHDLPSFARVENRDSYNGNLNPSSRALLWYLICVICNTIAIAITNLLFFWSHLRGRLCV